MSAIPILSQSYATVDSLKKNVQDWAVRGKFNMKYRTKIQIKLSIDVDTMIWMISAVIGDFAEIVLMKEISSLGKDTQVLTLNHLVGLPNLVIPI